MESKRFAVGALVLALAMPFASWAVEDQPPKAHRTLDEMTKKITKETRPDGSTVVTRIAAGYVPWDEFLAAQAAELDTSGSASPLEPLELDLLSGVCIPPDADYDGDGLVGAEEGFPLTLGEYVADRPRMVAEPYSYIDTSLAYKYTGTTTWTRVTEQLNTNDLVVTTTVHDTIEMQQTFNGKIGLLLKFSLASLKPTFELNTDGSYWEYMHKATRKWDKSVIETIHDFYSVKVTETENESLSWDETDGHVSGQIKFQNLYDGGYGRTVILSNVNVHAVAYNPYTGRKYWVGSQTFSGPYELPYGVDVSVIDAMNLTQVDSFETAKSLAEGRVFDFELASFTAVDAETGESINTLVTTVNQRTARLSIHNYRDGERISRQVSLFRPDNQCLTVKTMLETVVPADELEFERMTDGTLVVKRIGDRANRYADRDFWDLTAEEKAEYGRWIVGYNFGTVNMATELDLESTYLATDDAISLYYLTASDFEDAWPLPDYVAPFAVANDGTTTATVLPAVSAMDRIELDVDTSFLIYNPASPYSQYVGNIYSSVCGTVLSATWHSYNVLADSNLNYYPVGDADFYGMQIQIGDGAWMTIADLLANEVAGATLTELRGYPYYDFTVRFHAHPGLFGDDYLPSVNVRNAKPRQNLLVGYTGYDVMGRTVSCYYYTNLGYFRNDGEVRLSYTIDDADLDVDGFYASTRDGIDFDDVSKRRFPFAPEHLDGIDNDGDGAADENPLLCPDSVESGMAGTCELDDRMGWYEDDPNIEMQERLHYTDGSTSSWQTVGSILEYPFVMSTDPNVSGLEVKAIHWTTPVPYEGSNLIARTTPCLDADGDGWTTCDGDCDDSSNVTYPGAPELCDGLDNDCDGTVPTNEADADGDGYRVCSGDCNDSNDDVHPGAAEVCSTPFDDDCDGYVNEGCGGGSPIFRKPTPVQVSAD